MVLRVLVWVLRVLIVRFLVLLLLALRCLMFGGDHFWSPIVCEFLTIDCGKLTDRNLKFIGDGPLVNTLFVLLYFKNKYYIFLDMVHSTSWLIEGLDFVHRKIFLEYYFFVITHLILLLI